MRVTLVLDQKLDRFYITNLIELPLQRADGLLRALEQKWKTAR